jgi:hypothetical protein
MGCIYPRGSVVNQAPRSRLDLWDSDVREIRAMARDGTR